MEPALNSVEIGNFVFTLTAPTTTFSINDTLRATVLIYNPTAVPETLYVDFEYFDWWLKNDKGDTLMEYYGPIPLGEYLVIDSHQSRSAEEYSIYHRITSKSGSPVAPGSYILEAVIRGSPFNKYQVVMILKLTLK